MATTSARQHRHPPPGEVAAGAAPGRRQGLLALQATAGNRAVAGVVPVQRHLRFGSASTPVSVAALEIKWKTFAKIPAPLRSLIDWVAGNATHHIDFTTLEGLKLEASSMLENPPTAYLDSLSVSELQALQAHAGKKIKAASTLSADLDRRIMATRLASFGGQTPTLHVPEHDPHYNLPGKAADTALETTGRGGGEWTRVANTLPGLGSKTTGSTNLELGTREIAKGNWVSIGSIHVQICPGCAESKDVATLQVDHQQALADIRSRLIGLADLMTADPSIRAQVAGTTTEYGTYFMETTSSSGGTVVQATEAVLSHFSNDISNLMRICGKCNGATDKGDMNFIDWYRKSPLFGDLFLKQNLGTQPTGDVLARTVHGTGWGDAARNWFHAHHFPILQQRFVADRLANLIGNNLVRQSTAALQGRFAPTVPEQQQFEEESARLGRFNTASTTSVEELHSYLGSNPPDWSPGSPADWADIKGAGQRRNERKRRRVDESSEPYQAGRQVGFSSTVPFPSRYDADPTESTRYRLGIEKGGAEAQAERDQAYLDAVQGLPMPPSPSEAYLGGRTEGLRMTRRTAAAGLIAGGSFQPPDLSSIPEGAPGEAALLRKYIEAYGAAVHQRQQAATPPPQTPMPLPSSPQIRPPLPQHQLRLPPPQLLSSAPIRPQLPQYQMPQPPMYPQPPMFPQHQMFQQPPVFPPYSVFPPPNITTTSTSTPPPPWLLRQQRQQQQGPYPNYPHQGQ